MDQIDAQKLPVEALQLGAAAGATSCGWTGAATGRCQGSDANSNLSSLVVACCSQEAVEKERARAFDLQAAIMLLWLRARMHWSQSWKNWQHLKWRGFQEELFGQLVWLVLAAMNVISLLQPKCSFYRQPSRIWWQRRLDWHGCDLQDSSDLLRRGLRSRLLEFYRL